MTTPPILPFVTADAYCEAAGTPSRVLHDGETVGHGPELVFPEPDPGFFEPASDHHAFPAVAVTTLADGLVRGQSNLIAMPDAVLRHGLIDLENDLSPEEFYNRLNLSEDFATASWAAADPFEVDYLPTAAAFTDGTAFNYAHWMTEVLPRIGAFAGIASLEDIPLIVDADLHPNIVRSIELVAGPRVQIHRLRRSSAVRVGRLHNVSPVGYVPFKRRARTEQGLSHGQFGAGVLSGMVDGLRQAVSAALHPGPGLKLFIRRNSNIRHVINEAEIEERLVAAGFTVIHPDRMAIEDQVTTFSQARMVVGASGAAMTNLLFCRPDCPVIVLIPRFQYTAYWYWRNMASAVGVTVVHVTGERLARPDEDPFDPVAVHSDYRVEVTDLLDAIAAAEQMRA